VLNFPKIVVFDAFFPEIFRNFRNFGNFRGNFLPKNTRFSRKFFPANFAEIGCIFASYRKKPEEKRTFFSRNFGGFPGDTSRHFRGIFFGKNMNFDEFYTNFNAVYTAAQSGFYKKHKISQKSSRQFWNFRNSEKKFSPKSRKFSPTFSEIPGFSGNSRIFHNFRYFTKTFRNLYPVDTTTCNDGIMHALQQYKTSTEKKIIRILRKYICILIRLHTDLYS
jgi:hypothetical protein